MIGGVQEGWKDEFLQEIKANIQSEGKKYKIIGLPFYSKIKENEFRAVFNKNV